MAKQQKTVQIIARIQFKADPRKVCYLVRSSNGTDQYTTCLFDGKACSCDCKSKKPCYHMTQLEAKEAARSPKMVRMSNGTQRLASQIDDACLNALDSMGASYTEQKQAHLEQREAALAKAQAESAELLARIEAETLASIADSRAQASRPRSEQAAIADLPYRTTTSEHRQTAPLAGASRAFSMFR